MSISLYLSHTACALIVSCGAFDDRALGKKRKVREGGKMAPVCVDGWRPGPLQLHTGVCVIVKQDQLAEHASCKLLTFPVCSPSESRLINVTSIDCL